MILSATLLCGVFLFAVVASLAYFRVASVYGPYALPNHRSLHQAVIPRGGGLAVAAAILAGISVLATRGMLSRQLVLLLLVGGPVVAIFGMADDRWDIRPRYRLLMQLVSVAWLMYQTGGLPPIAIGSLIVHPGVVGNALLAFALLWFHNLYNFVDGSDGMAASATVYVAGAMAVVLGVAGQYDLALILGFAAAASLAFLFFNWPPARMFLGDAGTSFLSYLFSAVALISIARGGTTLWAWAIALVFYVSDTTTTTTIRAVRVGSHFYRGHRSHAYQNLARIWGHLRVLLAVIAIDLLWSAPWLAASVLRPTWSAMFAAVAYLPVVILCLSFGPLYQDV